jgi:hypothetical protein
MQINNHSFGTPFGHTTPGSRWCSSRAIWERKIRKALSQTNDLSPSRLRSFLEYLEKERGCSGATRNLRLAETY